MRKVDYFFEDKQYTKKMLVLRNNEGRKKLLQILENNVLKKIVLLPEFYTKEIEWESIGDGKIRIEEIQI